ncbi:uncharacterized protein LOC130684171 [Manis pentadactyla]|uniref:uncharacterized protein LOC130684171 n=1 Tax=Manis pentadactyla TaxID=143292 RepID=UPI00255C67D9|nr:uncharacterized protein LOC130684171 [Manis pentadactyla]
MSVRHRAQSRPRLTAPAANERAAPLSRLPLGAGGASPPPYSTVNSVASAVGGRCFRGSVRAPVRRPVRAASPPDPRWWTRAVLGCAFLPARRHRRYRPRPLVSDLLLAPAGLPGPHSPLLRSPAADGGRRSTRTWSRCSGRTCARPALPLPVWRRRAARPGRGGRGEPGRETAPAAAELRRSVQSGPRFRGEGDSDGSAGQKVVCTLREFDKYRQYLTSLKLDFEKNYIKEQVSYPENELRYDMKKNFQHQHCLEDSCQKMIIKKPQQRSTHCYSCRCTHPTRSWTCHGNEEGDI